MIDSSSAWSRLVTVEMCTDDHVLELAVAASGADIVTHNVKDFINASSFGVKIITPAQLLGELR